MKMSIFFAESFKEHTEEEMKEIMVRIMFLMKSAKLLKNNKHQNNDVKSNHPSG